MRTIFKLPEGIFSSCSQIHLEEKDKRHCSFCQVKPACFPWRSICTYASEQSPARQLRQGRLQEMFCFVRTEVENRLPSYTASFSRICFCQFKEVPAGVYNMNTLGSWGCELRFPLELKEPHAAARGWQAAKFLFTWQHILTLTPLSIHETIGNASNC